MSYRITITKITEKKYAPSRGEHTKLGQRLITADEIDKSGHRDRLNWDKVIENGTIPIIEHWGYLDPVETIRKESTEIYTQELEDMDIRKVILAINSEEKK